LEVKWLISAYLRGFLGASDLYALKLLWGDLLRLDLPSTRMMLFTLHAFHLYHQFKYIQLQHHAVSSGHLRFQVTIAFCHRI
jgi:hypothetical protein